MSANSVVSALLKYEEDLFIRLGWPFWSLRTIEILSVLVCILFLLQNVSVTNSSSVDSDKENKDNSQSNTIEMKHSSSKTASLFSFRIFQAQYLSVYLIIMLADWLQGTNMYTLYTSYNVNVGTLFLTGFLSSAVFGTFLGVYIDRWGRKFGCLLFCVLEIVINLLEHIPSMPALMVGRVLGGLSTSLLFSSFESWMVSEHRKRGFSEELLSSTFAISSWGNGVVAICAGLFAQMASDVAGDIGPFQLAIILTVITLVLILSWTENYGKTDDVASIFSSIRSAAEVIWRSPSMLYLGLSQAFFEGAVYTFVFVWVPTLQRIITATSTNGQPQSLPTGLVFSSFMLAMTIGGMTFGILLPVFPGGAEGLTVFVYAVAAMAMAVPIFKFEFWWVLVAFLVLEAMVGMFNSCGATLRSRYYPEELQSSIMTVFRLPLNLLVVLGTKLSDYATSSNEGPEFISIQGVYLVIVGMFLVAMALQLVLIRGISAGKLREKSKFQ